MAGEYTVHSGKSGVTPPFFNYSQFPLLASSHFQRSSNKAVISALVEEFLAEKDQITGEDLGKLEKEVIVALSAKRRLITPAPSAQQQQQQQQLQSQQQQQQQLLQQQQQQSQEPGSSKPGSSSFQSKLEPPPPGSEWSVIAAYQELLAEEKVKEEAHVARMKKVNFRASLDDHIAKARELRAKTEDRSDKEYSVRVNEDVKRFFEEEKKKKDFIHKKHHDELMQRKQQIIDKMEAAKAAKMDQLEQEYRDLAMAAAQIEAEKEKMRGIRRRARENQDIVDKVSRSSPFSPGDGLLLLFAVFDVSVSVSVGVCVSALGTECLCFCWGMCLGTRYRARCFPRSH